MLPDGGPASGGTVLTITGDGFGGPQALDAVSFCPLGSNGQVAGQVAGCKLGTDIAGDLHTVQPVFGTVLRIKDPSWDVPPGSSSVTVWMFVTAGSGLREPAGVSGRGVSAAYDFTYK